MLTHISAKSTNACIGYNYYIYKKNSPLKQFLKKHFQKKQLKNSKNQITMFLRAPKHFKRGKQQIRFFRESYIFFLHHPQGLCFADMFAKSTEALFTKYQSFGKLRYLAASTLAHVSCRSTFKIKIL